MQKLKTILFFLILIFIFVGCNRILYEPDYSFNGIDDKQLRQELQEEYNNELRDRFIEEQTF